MARRVLIINLKNYAEILGEPALRLVRSAERVQAKLGKEQVEIMIAPPIPSISLLVSSSKDVRILSQKAEDANEGKSTGSIIPEALAAWGCAGSIINHSESRIAIQSAERLIPRMKKLGLISCLCVETVEELIAGLKLEPELIAIEPPELIGTGVSVSKARPELVSGSVGVVRGAGYKGTFLCGAGITNAEDAHAAVRLGAEGVLVASSVVKAPDWEEKMEEIARALLG
jgi:triosephosphate isomerase (TIM)